MLASKKTYGNIKIDDFDNNRTNLYDVEQDILNYILEKNDIDKNMVKNVEYLFYNKECKYKPTLKIELDDSFDSNSDLDKLTKVNGIYENAKNTCDFSREMNWHDYFTKMIAF